MAQKIQGKPSIGQIMKKIFKSNFQPKYGHFVHTVILRHASFLCRTPAIHQCRHLSFHYRHCTSFTPLHFGHFVHTPVTVVAREHAHADPFLAISSVVFINVCIQRTSGLRNRRHSCAKMKSVFDPKSGWVGHNLLQIWPKIGIFLKIFIVPSKNP